MIYQLAKTSPLLSGQVKINFILKGSQVDSIQYTPISPSIPFNYNNPEDVLNYSHGDNVKMLYNKISDSFYSTIGNSALNPTSLHRYVGLYDDTHDNTYEMGMKRLEYHKFNKQFEFFCPIWCDDKDLFDSLRFEICMKNKDGKTIYGKFIDFTDKQKEYLKSMYKSFCIEDKTDNSDLIYLSFNECRSYIRGLNVHSGNVQTIDTSYIIENLVSQERTVLETDNLISTLFKNHELVATQLFNFNFVFDLEDFMPYTFLKSMIAERVNVYVNVYCENELVEVRDIYSNYDFIPRYDIYTGIYSDGKKDTDNVLSYLGDNQCVDIINQNKLVQHTIHWALKNNPSSIFNMYNGFAPLLKGEPNCTGISNDETDMFTDIYDENKNPYGLFKYTNREDIKSDIGDLASLFVNEDIYNSVNISSKELDKSEYQTFGNIVIDNKKLRKRLNDYLSVFKSRTQNMSKDKNVGVFAGIDPEITAKITANYLVGVINELSCNDNFSLVGKPTDLPILQVFSHISPKGGKTKDIYSSQINTIKCGVLRLSRNITYNKIRSLIPKESLLTGMEYVYEVSDGNGNKRLFCKSSLSNYIYTRVDGRAGAQKLYILFIITDPDEVLKNNLYYNSFIDKDIFRDIFDKKQNNPSIIYDGYMSYPSIMITHNLFSELGRKNSFNPIVFNKKKNAYISQKHAVYNAIYLLSLVLKSAKMPNKITFKKSISKTKYNSPSIDTKEISYLKNEKTVLIYRYDMNIIPMFISIDDKVRQNNVYWCKQYNENNLNKDIQEPDNIDEYMKYSFSKFKPEYPSIGYYTLNSAIVDYSDYYLNAHDEQSVIKYNYKKEISWFKNNSMFYLPIEFIKSKVFETGHLLTESDIVDFIYEEINNTSEFSEYEMRKIITYYIKDLYQYTYKYDYVSDTDITQQRITIKFILK